MPNKKGHRIAASRDRAREVAKKKARQGGPSSAPSIRIAAVQTSTEPVAPSTSSEVAETAIPAGTAPTPQPPTAHVDSPAPRRAAPGPTLRQRREQESMAALAGASVARELTRIGAITLVIVIALVVLKVATPLGA